MRVRTQAIRVRYPSLRSLEMDIEIVENQVFKAVLLVEIQGTEPTLEVGESLILEWMDEPGKRARARVTAIEHTEEGVDSESLFSGWESLVITLKIDLQPSNFRHFPRLIGGVYVKYMMVQGHEDIHAWLQKKSDVEEVESLWQKGQRSPLNELVNFSVNGLSFSIAEPMDEAVELLCEVRIPDTDDQWRCLAKVIRVWKTDEGWEMAMNFLNPPIELTDALSQYTLKLQELTI